METEIQRHLRDALNGYVGDAERTAQVRLLQLEQIKSELATIASIGQWCAILLLVICVTVLGKAFHWF